MELETESAVTRLMSISYYDIWNRQYREPIGSLTSEEARARDQAGECFTVLVGDASNPECFIEINPAVGFFGVSFLDEHNRVFLEYGFVLQQNGLLFLSQATYREYDTERVPLRSTSYRFRTDGELLIEKGERPFRTASIVEGKFDSSLNWENRPEFGDYRGLIRKERMQV